LVTGGIFPMKRKRFADVGPGREKQAFYISLF
jgi:hypothetical protein